MEFYYGTTKTRLSEGRVFRNPSAFLGQADPRAKSVIIVGNWPRVEDAYMRACVPVTVVDASDTEVLFGGGLPVLKKAVEVEDDSIPHEMPASVCIPEDWQRLPWADLRRLAAAVNPSGEPVINKKEAYAAIEAALELRGNI